MVLDAIVELVAGMGWSEPSELHTYLILPSWT